MNKRTFTFYCAFYYYFDPFCVQSLRRPPIDHHNVKRYVVLHCMSITSVIIQLKNRKPELFKQMDAILVYFSDLIF